MLTYSDVLAQPSMHPVAAAAAAASPAVRSQPVLPHVQRRTFGIDVEGWCVTFPELCFMLGVQEDVGQESCAR